MESNVVAELVAIFDDENIYNECLPVLERIKGKYGYNYITESVEDNDIDSLVNILDVKMFNNMEDKVRCNMCEWEGYEEDLALLNEPSKVDNTSLEYFKGCPNCRTDNYLMDIKV